MFRYSGVLFAVLLSSVSASAGVLSDFNLIAFGNVTGNQHVDGRVLVGGNISGGTKVLAMQSGATSSLAKTPGVSSADGLVVGGQILSETHVNNGNVRVGGAASGRVNNVNSPNTISYKDKSVAGIVADARAEVARTTDYFDSLTANSMVKLGMNSSQFTSTPVDGIAVFDVDLKFFMGNGGPDLMGDLSADLFLFRVTDFDATDKYKMESIKASSSFNAFNNEFGQKSFQQKIVWYFPGTETLDLRNGIGGAVIAPDASITFNSQMGGTVVANDVNLRGEIHLPSLALPPIPTSTSAAPEPATIASVGLILCGALIGRRRRIRKQRKAA
tara:strand:- start:915 stop:1904 length:990 start_codon:yes stop_codon:yes gene_type:complete